MTHKGCVYGMVCTLIGTFSAWTSSSSVFVFVICNQFSMEKCAVAAGSKLICLVINESRICNIRNKNHSKKKKSKKKRTDLSSHVICISFGRLKHTNPWYYCTQKNKHNFAKGHVVLFFEIRRKSNLSKMANCLNDIQLWSKQIWPSTGIVHILTSCRRSFFVRLLCATKSSSDELASVCARSKNGNALRWIHWTSLAWPYRWLQRCIAFRRFAILLRWVFRLIPKKN